MVSVRHIFGKWSVLFSALMVLALMAPAIDALVCADDFLVPDTFSVTATSSSATTATGQGHKKQQPSDREHEGQNCAHGHIHAATNIEPGQSQDLLQFDHRMGPAQTVAQFIPTVHLSGLLRPPRA